MFINYKSGVIILVYVDNLLIFSSKKSLINEVKKQLEKKYKMKDLGDIDHILGMRVQQDKMLGTVTLDQSVYIKNFFYNYGIEDCHPVTTQVDGYEFLTASTAAEPRTNQFEYQKRIGSLMYAMTSTRPDIAFAVSKLSQFSHDPCVRHRVALDRVLKYLHGTLNLGLVFSKGLGQVNPIGFADTAYADSFDTRKSTHGMTMLLGNSACIWTSTKQRTISTSTTEAEYIAQCQASKQLIWASWWLQQLGFKERGPVELRCNNQGAIALMKNLENHFQTKHIDVQYHYV